jgi:Flp pilus assembly protein TadG
MKKRRGRRAERGAAITEFVLGAGVFFMIIFGIIEFGRLLYTHNALTDAARRGARYAVLNPSNAPCVRAVAVYGETNINPTTCAPTGPPLINGLTTANITVTYNGADLDNDPTTPNVPFNMNIGNVTVGVQNYIFNLSVPFVHLTMNMPAYRTTLTAESAGMVPCNIPCP